MNIWWYTLGFLFSEYYAVRHMAELKFLYTVHEFGPDEVSVFRQNTFLFSYAWIDGEEAGALSALGTIHAAWAEQENPQ